MNRRIVERVRSRLAQTKKNIHHMLIDNPNGITLEFVQTRLVKQDIHKDEKSIRGALYNLVREDRAISKRIGVVLVWYPGPKRPVPFGRTPKNIPARIRAAMIAMSRAAPNGTGYLAREVHGWIRENSKDPLTIIQVQGALSMGATNKNKSKRWVTREQDKTAGRFRYKLPHNHKLMHGISENDTSSVNCDTTILMEWIRREHPETIHLYTLQHSAGGPGIRNAGKLGAAIKALVKAGWLTPQPSRAGGKPGRPRINYLVHPSMYISDITYPDRPPTQQVEFDLSKAGSQAIAPQQQEEMVTTTTNESQTTDDKDEAPRNPASQQVIVADPASWINLPLRYAVYKVMEFYGDGVSGHSIEDLLTHLGSRWTDIQIDHSLRGLARSRIVEIKFVGMKPRYLLGKYKLNESNCPNHDELIFDAIKLFDQDRFNYLGYNAEEIGLHLQDAHGINIHQTDNRCSKLARSNKLDREMDRSRLRPIFRYRLPNSRPVVKQQPPETPETPDRQPPLAQPETPAEPVALPDTRAEVVSPLPFLTNLSNIANALRGTVGTAFASKELPPDARVDAFGIVDALDMLVRKLDKLS